MNTLLNFGKHVAIPVLFMLAIDMNANAQSPVESTHIDEKYAYTTVVYKTTAASDKDVLASLENDFGIGDVVRVTFAPPPAPISAVAASEPVYADKSKGEDAWLPSSAKSTDNLPASIKSNIAIKAKVKAIPVAPKSTPVPIKAVGPKLNVAAKTVASEVPLQVKTEHKATQIEAASASSLLNTRVKAKASTTGKAAKAHKSAKKAGKKGSAKKLKNRKLGKQRYACPNF